METTKIQEINQLLHQVNIFRNTIERLLWNSHASENSRYLSYRAMAIAYNELVKISEAKTGLSNFFVIFELEKIGEAFVVSNSAKKQILEHIFTHSNTLYFTLDKARFHF